MVGHHHCTPMLPRRKCHLGLKWCDKHWRHINSKRCWARDLVSNLGGCTEYKFLCAYSSSGTCCNLGLPLSCSASTWDWMWLSAWDLARLNTAQWHFPALQCTDRTPLIPIDTYLRFNFMAFCYSLLQLQCMMSIRTTDCNMVLKKLQSSIVMKSLWGRLCLQGRTKVRQKD